MAQKPCLADLPLLITGIAKPFREQIRLAGVPAIPFRHGVAAAGARGRFVVFDSRRVSSRFDARIAKSCGLETIDIAPLDPTVGSPISRDRHANSHGQRTGSPSFLKSLKDALESNGGVWMRVADYPFPFQSLLCVQKHAAVHPSAQTIDKLFNGLPVAEFFRVSNSRSNDWLFDSRHRATASSSNTAAFAWARPQYAAGLPFFDQNGVKDGFVAEFRNAVDGRSSEFPLLGRVAWSEFQIWWQVRGRICFEAWKQHGTYTVHTDRGFGGFQPALELWRGSHVATLPLSEGRITFEDQGLAFARGLPKHPGGFTAACADWCFTMRRKRAVQLAGARIAS